MRARVRSVVLAAVASLWVVAAAAGQASAAPGDLDQTFGGGDGQASTKFPAGGAYGYATLVQSDGKIIVGGQANHTADDASWALARYKPNGVLDPTFGDGGKVVVNLTGSDDVIYALHKAAHGTFYAAGQSSSSFVVARFLSDGHLDHTFSGDGKAFVSFATGPAFGYAMTVAPGGKVVVAGEVDHGSGDYKFGVARLTADGQLDHTFSGDGKATADLGTHSYAWQVIANSDGSIVAAGDANTTANTSPGLVKFTEDGTPDPNFGSNGIEVDDVGVDLGPDALIKLPNGKLLVAGAARTSPTTFDLGLVRFQANGHPDQTFGPNGFLTRNFGGTSEYPGTMVVSGKRLLVSLFHDDGTGSHLGVARLMMNGAADTAFSGDGLALATADFSYGNAVAVDAQHRIVVAGDTGVSDADSRFLVARFLST